MLFRKLIRTIGRYKSQFISMIIMTALGIGMFLGFNMEWISIEKNTFRFFDETAFADYRIMSEDGFAKKDAGKVAQIAGTEAVSRYIAVNADLKKVNSEEDTSGRVISVTVTENPEVSNFLLLEGSGYDENDDSGIWLFDKFAEKNNITEGDELTLSYDTLEFTGTVRGLIESSEYLIAIQDETQLMPDPVKYGYCYITPAMLEKTVSDYTAGEVSKKARESLEEAMNDAYDEAQKQLQEAKTQLDEAEAQLKEAEELISSSQVDSGLSAGFSLPAGMQLPDGMNIEMLASLTPEQLSAMLPEQAAMLQPYLQQIAQLEEQLARMKAQYEAGREEYEQGKKAYEDGLRQAEELKEEADRIQDMSDEELSDLMEEYTEKTLKETQDEASDEAMENIYHQINVISDLEKNEFKEEANKALGKTLVILSRDENVSYAESQGEVNEGKTMGSILPVLFLLISILTMVTTMHRIATNEKTQIGTLKALGFKDRRILMHYSCFTLLIAAIGTVLGIALGYLVCWIIMNPDGMMGTYLVMPYWDLFIPWWCWLVMALVIVLMLLVGMASTRKMMQGPAAEALKPYIPQISKPMFIERTRLWNRMKFAARWNMRDIARHKSRSAVTLIGVIGCMILMVAAIGMYETTNAFIKIAYTDNAGYASKAFVSDSADNEKAAELAGKYDGDYSASVSVQLNEETYSLDIYHIEHGLVRFTDADNNEIELKDDGAYVCMRIAEKFKLKAGDEITVSPFGTDDEYILKVSGVFRSITESIVISDTYAKTLKSDGIALTDSDRYTISNIYTGKEKTDISEELFSAVQSKTDISESMDSFMEIMNTFVVVLVLAAIVLGIVVLYNLGVMSYTERYRELATLKVVGFKDKKLKSLLIGQNLWLTVIGVIVGLAAGIGVLVYLLKALAPEYEMKVVIGPLTVIVSIVVTFAVSLIVGLMVSKKSRKIDMVEALKMPE